MKIHLLVERENTREAASWVIDAVDEWTLDEHGGEYPPDFQDKLSHLNEDLNRRVLIVEIPDNSLERIWDIPIVSGKVAE